MSLEQEYRAAREGCALWDTDFRRLLTATGEDRVTFLHGMLSNDIKVLRPGTGTYAALLTQQGKIVSDLRVYADADRLLLDVPAERADAVLNALQKFIVADDVELSINHDEQPLLAVTGPSSAMLLGTVLQTSLPPRTALAHQLYPFSGGTLRLVAVDDCDGAGYTLCGPAAIADDLRRRLCDGGAQPSGRETLDVLRVEAGVPWYGIDMDEEILLMETNLDRAVSFTKGCYLGQEVVERVAARGKVNKKLTGLRLDGDVVPTAGTPLRADGKDIGRVTSSVRSPALGKIIALAYVHRDFLEPGTTITVATSPKESKAAVCSLPFVTT